MKTSSLSKLRIVLNLFIISLFIFTLSVSAQLEDQDPTLATDPLSRFENSPTAENFAQLPPAQQTPQNFAQLPVNQQLNFLTTNYRNDLALTFYDDVTNVGKDVELDKTFFTGDNDAKQSGENIFANKEASTVYFEKTFGNSYTFEGKATDFALILDDTNDIDSAKLLNNGNTLFLVEFKNTKEVTGIEVIDDGFRILRKNGKKIDVNVEDEVHFDGNSPNTLQLGSINSRQGRVTVQDDDVTISQQEGALRISGKANGVTLIDGKRVEFQNRYGELVLYENGNLDARDAEVKTPEIYINGYVEKRGDQVTAWAHGNSAVNAGQTVVIDGRSGYGIKIAQSKSQGHRALLKLESLPAESDKTVAQASADGSLEQFRARAAALKPATKNNGENFDATIARSLDGRVQITANGKGQVNYYNGGSQPYHSRPSYLGHTGSSEYVLKTNGRTEVHVRGQATYKDSQYAAIRSNQDGASLSIMRNKGDKDDLILADCFSCSNGNAMSIQKYVPLAGKIDDPNGELGSPIMRRIGGTTFSVEVTVEGGSAQFNLDKTSLGELSELQKQGVALLGNKMIVEIPRPPGNRQQLTLQNANGRVQVFSDRVDASGAVISGSRQVIDFGITNTIGDELLITSDKNAENTQRLLAALQSSNPAAALQRANLDFDNDPKLRAYLLQETGIDINLVGNDVYTKQIASLRGYDIELTPAGGCIPEDCARIQQAVIKGERLAYVYSAARIQILQSQNALLRSMRDTPEQERKGDIQTAIEANEQEIKQLTSMRTQMDQIGQQRVAQQEAPTQAQTQREELLSRNPVDADFNRLNAQNIRVWKESLDVDVAKTQVELADAQSALSGLSSNPAFFGKEGLRQRLSEEARLRQRITELKSTQESLELERARAEEQLVSLVGQHVADSPAFAAELATTGGSTEYAREIAEVAVKSIDVAQANILKIEAYAADGDIAGIVQVEKGIDREQVGGLQVAEVTYSAQEQRKIEDLKLDAAIAQAKEIQQTRDELWQEKQTEIINPTVFGSETAYQVFAAMESFAHAAISVAAEDSAELYGVSADAIDDKGFLEAKVQVKEIAVNELNEKRLEAGILVGKLQRAKELGGTLDEALQETRDNKFTTGLRASATFQNLEAEAQGVDPTLEAQARAAEEDVELLKTFHEDEEFFVRNERRQLAEEYEGTQVGAANAEIAAEFGEGTIDTAVGFLQTGEGQTIVATLVMDPGNLVGASMVGKVAKTAGALGKVAGATNTGIRITQAARTGLTAAKASQVGRVVIGTGRVAAGTARVVTAPVRVVGRVVGSGIESTQRFLGTTGRLLADDVVTRTNELQQAQEALSLTRSLGGSSSEVAQATQRVEDATTALSAAQQTQSAHAVAKTTSRLAITRDICLRAACKQTQQAAVDAANNLDDLLAQPAIRQSIQSGRTPTQVVEAARRVETTSKAAEAQTFSAALERSLGRALGVAEDSARSAGRVQSAAQIARAREGLRELDGALSLTDDIETGGLAVVDDVGALSPAAKAQAEAVVADTTRVLEAEGISISGVVDDAVDAQRELARQATSPLAEARSVQEGVAAASQGRLGSAVPDAAFGRVGDDLGEGASRAEVVAASNGNLRGPLDDLPRSQDVTDTARKIDGGPCPFVGNAFVGLVVNPCVPLNIDDSNPIQSFGRNEILDTVDNEASLRIEPGSELRIQIEPQVTSEDLLPSIDRITGKFIFEMKDKIVVKLANGKLKHIPKENILRVDDYGIRQAKPDDLLANQPVFFGESPPVSRGAVANDASSIQEIKTYAGEELQQGIATLNSRTEIEVVIKKGSLVQQQELTKSQRSFDVTFVSERGNLIFVEDASGEVFHLYKDDVLEIKDYGRIEITRGELIIISKKADDPSDIGVYYGRYLDEDEDIIRIVDEAGDVFEVRKEEIYLNSIEDVTPEELQRLVGDVEIPDEIPVSVVDEGTELDEFDEIQAVYGEVEIAVEPLLVESRAEVALDIRETRVVAGREETVEYTVTGSFVEDAQDTIIIQDETGAFVSFNRENVVGLRDRGKIDVDYGSLVIAQRTSASPGEEFVYGRYLEEDATQITLIDAAGNPFLVAKSDILLDTFTDVSATRLQSLIGDAQIPPASVVPQGPDLIARSQVTSRPSSEALVKDVSPDSAQGKLEEIIGEETIVQRPGSTPTEETVSQRPDSTPTEETIARRPQSPVVQPEEGKVIGGEQPIVPISRPEQIVDLRATREEIEDDIVDNFIRNLASDEVDPLGNPVSLVPASDKPLEIGRDALTSLGVQPNRIPLTAQWNPVLSRTENLETMAANLPEGGILHSQGRHYAVAKEQDTWFNVGSRRIPKFWQRERSLYTYSIDPATGSLERAKLVATTQEASSIRQARDADNVVSLETLIEARANYVTGTLLDDVSSAETLRTLEGTSYNDRAAVLYDLTVFEGQVNLPITTRSKVSLQLREGLGPRGLSGIEGPSRIENVFVVGQDDVALFVQRANGEIVPVPKSQMLAVVDFGRPAIAKGTPVRVTSDGNLVDNAGRPLPLKGRYVGETEEHIILEYGATRETFRISKNEVNLHTLQQIKPKKLNEPTPGFDELFVASTNLDTPEVKFLNDLNQGTQDFLRRSGLARLTPEGEEYVVLQRLAPDIDDQGNVILNKQTGKPQRSDAKDIKESYGEFVRQTQFNQYEVIDQLGLWQTAAMQNAEGSWEFVKVGINYPGDSRLVTFDDTIRKQAMADELGKELGLFVPERRVIEVGNGIQLQATEALQNLQSLGKDDIGRNLQKFFTDNNVPLEEQARLQEQMRTYAALVTWSSATDFELSVARINGRWELVAPDLETLFTGAELPGRSPFVSFREYKLEGDGVWPDINNLGEAQPAGNDQIFTGIQRSDYLMEDGSFDIVRFQQDFNPIIQRFNALLEGEQVVLRTRLQNAGYNDAEINVIIEFLQESNSGASPLRQRLIDVIDNDGTGYLLYDNRIGNLQQAVDEQRALGGTINPGLRGYQEAVPDEVTGQFTVDPAQLAQAG